MVNGECAAGAIFSDGTYGRNRDHLSALRGNVPAPDRYFAGRTITDRRLRSLLPADCSDHFLSTRRGGECLGSAGVIDVIPSRADDEGSRSRRRNHARALSRFTKICVTNERQHCSCSDRPPARSLGALRQPRDDLASTWSLNRRRRFENGLPLAANSMFGSEAAIVANEFRFPKRRGIVAELFQNINRCAAQ